MKYSSIAEINSITVDEVIIELMSRLLDLSVIPIGTNFYNLLPEGQDLYERVQVHILLTKPSMEELEFELINYKLEILEAFDETAAERERVEALETRFTALSDLRVLMSRTNNQQPNMKIFKRDLINDDNTALLGILEAEDAIYKVEKAEDDDLHDDIREGKRAKEVCDELLNVIRGRNGKRSFKRSEVRAMKTAFADLLEFLRDGMPSEARVEVDAVTETTVLDLKVKLQKVLTRRGF